MAQASMDAIVRKRRRKGSRWLHTEVRKRREALILPVLQALPGFFLALSDVMGIPSGFQVAYMAAVAVRAGEVRPVLIGALAAMALRLIWGVHPHGELLMTYALLWFGSVRLREKGTAAMLICTAALLLPLPLTCALTGTPAYLIQSLSSVLLGVLSAPVYVRALETLEKGKSMELLEDRLSVGYLAMTLLCGGGRMLAVGMNVGVLCASVLTLWSGMFLGMGAGAVAGLCAGMVLAMQGLPLALSIALGVGGVMAGTAQIAGKRAVASIGFGAGSLLVILMTGADSSGCMLAMMAAAFGCAFVPRQGQEQVQLFFHRMLMKPAVSGDAYAASALAAWEKTVAAMAQAVPSPSHYPEKRDGAWWQAQLCRDCPELERCGCMNTERAAQQAERVWQARASAPEVWLEALDHLRGLGCSRLYLLREAIERLREEQRAKERQTARIITQRDMLTTHLHALSGAVRRFAMLSAGDSWWDDMHARRLRKALSELNYPAAVMYVRRVQGHIRAALSLHAETGSEGQAEEICALASRVMETPMSVISVEQGRIELSEQPIFEVEAGVALRGFENGAYNGDTAWTGVLQDGRYLAALSDGMGHGAQAEEESCKTVELLRLCLEAGYTRSQALTAVNGMMLMAGQGESFSTVDLVTIDLWTGHAALDKLGAAGSWIAQEEGLTLLAGDALPLGILESVEARSAVVRLRAGDEVVLMTDGVEEAFPHKTALENAVRSALAEPTAQRAAQALLDQAAEQQGRQDDQSVIVLRLERSQV